MPRRATGSCQGPHPPVPPFAGAKHDAGRHNRSLLIFTKSPPDTFRARKFTGLSLQRRHPPPDIHHRNRIDARFSARPGLRPLGFVHAVVHDRHVRPPACKPAEVARPAGLPALRRRRALHRHAAVHDALRCGADSAPASVAGWPGWSRCRSSCSSSALATLACRACRTPAPRARTTRP